MKSLYDQGGKFFYLMAGKVKFEKKKTNSTKLYIGEVTRTQPTRTFGQGVLIDDMYSL